MKYLPIICVILACGPTTEDFMGLNVNFEGVYRGPNRHSQVPQGAAERAENLVSYNKGEAAVVAGMETLAGTYTERFSSGIPYDGFVIERSSTGGLYRRNPGVSVTAITTGISPPSGVQRVPYTEAGQRLYMATDAGVKFMDGGSTSPVAVEMPKPLGFAAIGAGGGELFSGAGARAEGTVTLGGGAGDVTITVGGTTVGPVAFSVDDTTTAANCVTALNASPGVAVLATASSVGPVITITALDPGVGGNDVALSSSRTAGTAVSSGSRLSGGTGESVAYRYVIARQLADGTYRRSAPSGRDVYVSHTGSEDVTMLLALPQGIVATDRIEVYRTAIADVGIDPGDIMYLVAQVDPAANVVSGATHIQQITDSTPDALRGEPLYTNGTQGGILRQNDPPPMAKVLEGFDDYVLAMNVQGPQRFSFRFIGVPDVNDTLVIAGVTYTCVTGSDSTLNQFECATGGTVAENIAATAKSLVATINYWPGWTPARTVHAFYLSGASDAPGIVMIETRAITTGAFTVVAGANGDRYEPPLSSAKTSDATTEPSGIYVSKRGEHYAFPPLRSATATYRFRAGTKGREILAARALREAVIVFTNGDGVFKVQRVGNELWRADQISSTLLLLNPDSVAVVDNQVIALTNKGIVAVDTGGVEEIDLPIKKAVDSILALSSSTLTNYTFGVGDDARNRYILYHPESNSDTAATHAWVYNGTTGTWTERTDDATGGFVDPDTGLLYLGSATSNTLTRERTGTDAQVYKRPDNTAIPVRLDWTVMDEGDPGASKQYTELRLLTEDAITGNVTFACTNDLNGSESTTGSTSDDSDGEPFVRAWVPDGCQWTSRLKVSVQRSVLSEPFTVVGMKTLLAGMEDGSFTR
jgi:hypothetical protein